ncbi:intradiol ring-cleavage dioxygenase [Gordonia sp. HY285]|uniref:intradiol ring-cleavage dioxygenase n=1 Tax=Gordonia liuliyuniae TaxID=2911517 RepID=UPI001F2AA50D|nr:intradiol ring-cleavage dioxygenase [Gordonia liuliyuniae]MCF8611383.1 intradiol ring-cleavage dioxygenase [Gordonia liuliyuniae]
MTDKTYQGRPLHRPDEPVVDQGAAFDLQTLSTRRKVLAFIGAGGAAALLAACSSGSSDTGASTSSSATTIGEIPDETAGPYPGDGSNGPDVLNRTGIVRSDIRSSLGGGTKVDGVPLRVTLDVTDIAGGDKPFTGAAVYAWHCTAQGEYSMYGEGIEDETFLRGVQVVDDSGSVTFTTIFPGCYSGRWPHIHFEVYPDVTSITDHTKAIATSQLALPQQACDAAYSRSTYSGSAENLSQITLASDNVFGDDGGKSQLASLTGNAVSGYTATLPVGVDTGTEPKADAAPGGADGPGGPPPNGSGKPGGAPPSRP